MLPPPTSVPPTLPPASAVTSALAPVRYWRLLAVAMPHLAALGILLQTETDFGSRLVFMLCWGGLNFSWIAVLRRPALSGALSLTMIVVLVLLSRLKHDIVQMTVNFVDLMMIDRDSIAFLFTIFPEPALVRGDLGAADRSADDRAVAARSVSYSAAAGGGHSARMHRRTCGFLADMAARGLARILRRQLYLKVRAFRRDRGIRFCQWRVHGIRRGRARAPEASLGRSVPSGGAAPRISS